VPRAVGDDDKGVPAGDLQAQGKALDLEFLTLPAFVRREGEHLGQVVQRDKHKGKVEALERKDYPDEKMTPVAVPQKYLDSELRAQWRSVTRAIALRRAQLWSQCLGTDEEDFVLDDGSHEGIDYQILMFDQSETVFQSAADLPAPC